MLDLEGVSARGQMEELGGEVGSIVTSCVQNFIHFLLFLVLI